MYMLLDFFMENTRCALQSIFADWEMELEAYGASHPEVRIHDLPRATYPLRNRGTMLYPVNGDGWELENPEKESGLSHVCCSVPQHCTLREGCDLEGARREMRSHGLEYPVLAKSIWADGRPGSHALAVVVSDDGLESLIDGRHSQELAPPFLLEQYINHGTCLFKVYVLGDNEVMVTRPSLHIDSSDDDDAVSAEVGSCGVECLGSSPPIPVPIETRLGGGKGGIEDVELVSRVSAYPRSTSWGKEDLAPRGHGVPTPPPWLWRGLATRLRDTLGLTLFNFDLIVPLDPPPDLRGLIDGEGKGLVHLIDINYFPGFEKLPGYEGLVVNFLESLRTT